MNVFGSRVNRAEDLQLLTSGGIYVDDLRVPELTGAAYATFVRSPVAHAVITRIDTSRAQAHPRVIAVYTATDLTDLPAPHPLRSPEHNGAFPAEPLLAGEKVRFVGEPVAIVLTEARHDGQDAAELVDVDYETLPAVVGRDQAALDDPRLVAPTPATPEELSA
ncbi:xanthine dehydrogenase family protein molybdopterin-binding subunit, partial [Saccharopolyspora cebuensis]